MSDNHEENKRLVALSRKANDVRYEAHSKATLKRHIETKFRTTMIGSLSRFEKIFGEEVWGYGLDEDLLTDTQKENQEKWQLARTEILNNGNNQMRAALAEVDNNTIRYNKMEYTFLLKKPQDSQEKSNV